jgi:glycosyltransferase involved in cell wall biosynthesis
LVTVPEPPPTPASGRSPRLLLFYHFFHPDDVAGARQFGDFAEEQRKRGWDVTVITSNRSYADPATALPAREWWRGIDIRRVFRPPLDQARPLNRLANSAWMVSAGLVQALALGGGGGAAFDAVVIGSDPAFALALAIPLRAARPRLPIIHWCFDLYPEAVEAEQGGEGAGGGRRRLTSALLLPAARALMARAYRACDEIVDLGPCMRARLAAYRSPARRTTLVPWALVEPARVAPPDPALRARLFPGAKLALLYSGTMGRAHDFELFLRLARACRARSGDAVSIRFACRGNRLTELRAAVGPEDTNVGFLPFADEGEIQTRLEAADIHLLSLRREWAGIVVPSKFFGSLAVGRPVLYAGPAESSIAGWIREHDVGLRLDDANINEVTERLHALIDDPADLIGWRARARDTYSQEFSKGVVNDRWDALLRRHLVSTTPDP